jgi:hypothetical protein
MATQYDFGGGQINIAGSLLFDRENYCRLYDGNSQTINHATATYVEFDNELDDPGGMHDTVTNNTRITPVKAGYYLVGAEVQWAIGTTGVRLTQIWKNRTSNYAFDGITWASAVRQSVCGIIYANGTTDYLEVSVYHYEGSSTSILDQFFWAALIIGA